MILYLRRRFHGLNENSKIVTYLSKFNLIAKSENYDWSNFELCVITYAMSLVGHEMWIFSQLWKKNDTEQL